MAKAQLSKTAAWFQIDSLEALIIIEYMYVTGKGRRQEESIRRSDIHFVGKWKSLRVKACIDRWRPNR